MTYKGNNSIRTTLAAIACTVVISTTCLLGAVGPATAHAAERGAAVTAAYSK